MNRPVSAAEVADGTPLALPQINGSTVEASGAGLHWVRALGSRVATLWLCKMAGTALGIASFFPAYFWVMHANEARAYVMPLTAVDAWIELREGALPLYASLWLYVSLPAAFAKDWTALVRYAAAATVMTCIGFAIFWALPTVVPAFPIDWALYPALGFLKNADAAGNAFPSLHVSFAVFAGMVLASQLRAIGAPMWLRAANLIWAAGIVYSTLATRQHVALDVLGGVLLSGLCWALFGNRTVQQQSPKELF